MEIISTILINTLVVLIFSMIIYRFTKGESSSFLHVVLFFMAGVFSAIPSFYIEFVISEKGLDNVTETGDLLLNAFLYVGFNEELSKYILLLTFSRLFMWTKTAMDIYRTSLFIGLGFAMLENVLYSINFGGSTALFRAVTAVPAHLCFAVIMGYFLAFGMKIRWLVASLFIPTLLHGLYDLFILQEYAEWMMIFSLLILSLLILYSVKKLRQAHSNQNL